MFSMLSALANMRLDTGDKKAERVLILLDNPKNYLGVFPETGAQFIDELALKAIEGKPSRSLVELAHTLNLITRFRTSYAPMTTAENRDSILPLLFPLAHEEMSLRNIVKFHNDESMCPQYILGSCKTGIIWTYIYVQEVRWYDHPPVVVYHRKKIHWADMLPVPEHMEQGLKQRVFKSEAL